MSDNLRRYCAIHDALRQLAPKQMTGNQIRHLRTLSAFISGITRKRVPGQRTHQLAGYRQPHPRPQTTRKPHQALSPLPCQSSG